MAPNKLPASTYLKSMANSDGIAYNFEQKASVL